MITTILVVIEISYARSRNDNYRYNRSFHSTICEKRIFSHTGSF